MENNNPSKISRSASNLYKNHKKWVFSAYIVCFVQKKQGHINEKGKFV